MIWLLALAVIAPTVFFYFLVIKATDRAGAVTAVGEAVADVARLREARGVALSVDVDPQ